MGREFSFWQGIIEFTHRWAWAEYQNVVNRRGHRGIGQSFDERGALYAVWHPVRDMLLNGELIATGIELPVTDQSARVEIPKDYWRHSELVGPSSQISFQGRHFREVRLHEALSSNVESTKPTKKKRRSASQEEVDRWYRSRKAKFIKAGLRSDREEDRRDGNIQSGGRFIQKQIDHARRRFGGKWTEPGRPRASSKISAKKS